MAKRSRLDDTHKIVRNTLTALGCSVASTSDVGSGFPDMVVGLVGQTHLVEAKTGKGKLRDSQTGFQARWSGSPVWVLRSAEDAMVMVSSIRKEATKGEMAHLKGGGGAARRQA